MALPALRPARAAERLHLYGYPLLVVRIAVTLVVATGSFYLVEEPIRRRRTRTFTEWRAWLADRGGLPGRGGGHRRRHPPVDGRGRRPAARGQGAEYSGPPVKVVIFGDSVAWRLGFAMLASQPQNSYDVNIDNGAIVGCGVLRSTEYRRPRRAQPGEPRPATPRRPSPTSGRPSGQGDLDQFQPNVVVVLAGRWEVADRLIDGHWLHIGEPAFDADAQAVARAGGAGGHLDRAP